MTEYEGTSAHGALGLSALLALPTVPAPEFADWGRASASTAGAAMPSTGQCGGSPFEDEREHRFCKAIAEHPMQPSSQYAKLARMSSKTAVRIRRRLIEIGYIREHTVDPAGRGRSTILLEVLTAGVDAIAQYESQENAG